LSRKNNGGGEERQVKIKGKLVVPVRGHLKGIKKKKKKYYLI